MPSTDVLPRLVATDTDGLKSYIAWAVTCHGPSVDLNHIDVSAIRDMSLLFSNSPFNGNVSTWQLTMPVTLDRVFQFSAFQGDVSNWDVSTVHSMVGLFEGSQFNGDLSKWNVSNVQTFARMFKNSQFNGDISNWTIGRADNMLK